MTVRGQATLTCGHLSHRHVRLVDIGTSSRSTLMQTNDAFSNAATASSLNDSFSMTWHQWHDE